MNALTIAARTVLLSVLLGLLLFGCYRSGRTKPVAVVDPIVPDIFTPDNPGTVLPDYGPVGGGNTVTVLLPSEFVKAYGDFLIPPGITNISFGGIPASNVVIGPEREKAWFLTCTVPPSSTGEKQLVDVLIETFVPGALGYPVQVFTNMEDAYTYIDATNIDFLARGAFSFPPVTDLVATDYDFDGVTDVIGLHAKYSGLVFIKNMGDGEFVFDFVRPVLPGGSPTPYSGLIAGNVNGDGLDDLVIFGEEQFALLLKHPKLPGEYRFSLSDEFRRGIAGHINDLNRDGFGDLIVGGPDGVRIFGYIPQIGMFTDHPLSLDQTPTLLALVSDDIDGDGDVDIMTLTHDKLIWYLGKGIGNYVKQDPPISLEPVDPEKGMRQVLTADVNKDTFPDLVFAAAEDDRVYGGPESPDSVVDKGALGVALADTSGGFLDPVYYTIPAVDKKLTGATDLDVLDVDFDGADDILVSVPGRNSVIFFKGDGAGGFTAQQYYGVGNNPMSLTVIDGNLDGAPGLIVAEPEAASLSYMEVMVSQSVKAGADNAEFRCGVDLPLDFNPSVVKAVDMDDDGLVDLLVSDSRKAMLTVLMNDGMGGFNPTMDLTVPGKLLTDFCIFQGNTGFDNMPDVGIISSNGEGNPGTLTVFLNDGLGDLVHFNEWSVGADPVQIRAANVNNDIFEDLVILETGGESLSIFLGDSFADLSLPIPRSPLTAPYGLTLSDLDLDFDTDALVASPDGQTVSMLPTVVSLEGSKFEADPLTMGSGFTTLYTGTDVSDSAAADFDLDGDVDIAFNGLDDAEAFLFIHDGFGNYTPGPSYMLAGPSACLLAVNLNLDLDTLNRPMTDLVATVPSVYGLDLLEMMVDGTLMKTIDSPLPVNRFRMDARPVFVDLNEDLLPELIVPSNEEMKLTILINNSVTAAYKQ